MPNPKRRHSKARTSKRRANDFLTPKSVSVCTQCGASVMPHRVCKDCGFYKGREVIEAEAE